MDVGAVIALLEATLSADNAARKAAEASLDSLSQSPGWPSGLLQIISSPASTPTMRLASALALKRAATTTWHPEGDPPAPSPYPADVKEYGASGRRRCCTRAHARVSALAPAFAAPRRELLR